MGNGASLDRLRHGALTPRFHYGSPVVGYAAALLLIVAAGAARTAMLQNGDVRAPFLFFYPAIAAAAFLGGAGPGLLTSAAAAVFGGFLFPAFPPASSWITLVVLGPFLAACFAQVRGTREKSAALAREFERFRFISEHVSDWIFLTDRSGGIQYINKTAARQLGWPAEALIHRPLADLTPEWQKPLLGDLLAKCHHSVTIPAEITLNRRDGASVPVEAVCTGVRVSEELVIHVAARDTSERRQMEQKLLEARQWESLGVMAGGLAHDFNNLLTSIMGNASLAKDSVPPDHALVPLLDSVERAGDRCAELVRLMLATAGYRPRFRERLRVDRILNGLLANRPIPVHVRVNTEVADPVFFGDERSMEMLLWSLISNAAESYGDSSGEVQVSVGLAPVPQMLPGSFEEGSIEPGRCFGIVVEDCGSGMAPEVLERAFDPFFSTKFTGRGLGLPAVRGIVRAHAGKLWLTTKPGAGTRIEVWLPAPE